jgi:hypothetical protein
MEVSLKSGSKGHVQYVNSNERAHTHAVSEDEGIYELLKSKAYNLNSGLITSITGDGTLLYFKNGEEEEFIVQTIVVGVYDGITYSDFPDMEIRLDATGGDLISDATAVSYKQNRRAVTTNPLSSDTLVYKGKNGGTLTGGNGFGLLQLAKTGRSTFPINIAVPQGGSVGLKFTLNASSGTTKMYAALVGYLKDKASQDPGSN